MTNPEEIPVLLTRRRALAALAGAAAVPLLAACPAGEAEDCDAEDQANNEPECDDDHGGRRRKRKPTKTKTKSGRR